MGKTMMENKINSSMIQSVIDNKVMVGLMAYPSMLIARSRGGALQSLEIHKYIPIPRVGRCNEEEVFIKK
jgi:hypothetical protein